MFKLVKRFSLCVGLAQGHNRHVSTCAVAEETLLSLTTPTGQAAPRSSGFNQLKSKFMGAKPSMLAPLIPAMVADGSSAANETANNSMQAPQTTRGTL